MDTVNEHKTETAIYWVGIGLIALWFGTSGLFELTKNPIVWNQTLALGYPPYFITALGVAKICGVIVLLIPRPLSRLREWVFAALFFDVIFAFISCYSVFGFPACKPAIIAFFILLVTYVSLRRRNTARVNPSDRS